MPFFKKGKQGENFKAYLLEVRMKKALQYLMETNMKTYELASQVGYKDVRTFTDKFRDFYGCSPANIRRTTDNFTMGFLIEKSGIFGSPS